MITPTNSLVSDGHTTKGKETSTRSDSLTDSTNHHDSNKEVHSKPNTRNSSDSKTNNDHPASSRPDGPRKPNPLREALNQKMEKLDYEITNLRSKLNDVQTGINQISLTSKKPDSSTESPAYSGSAVVMTGGPSGIFSELKEKKNRMYALIDTKTKAQESMKKLREEISAKVKLLSECKNNEKSIVDLERKLENGNIKIVEERKLITEISKLKKTFVPFNSLQSDIEALETSMEVLRVTRDSSNVEIDSLKAEIQKIQSSLKEFDAQKQGRQEQMSVLQDQKKEIRAKIDSLYDEKKKLMEAFKKGQEERNVKYQRDKLRREMQNKRDEVYRQIEELEDKISNLELSADQEIESCDSLVVILRSLFPSTAAVVPAVAPCESHQCSTERKVEAPKDLVLIDRRQEADFLGTTATKKTSKRHQKKTQSDSSFRLPLNIVAGLGSLGLSLPLNEDDVSASIVKLNHKKEELQSKSDDRKRIIGAQKDKIEVQIGELRAKISEMDAEIANVK